MNKSILDSEVQQYISDHLNDDVHKIAMAKSPFQHVGAKELAGQILAKNKSAKKLPAWYNHDCIYYPTPLSIEQTSSEATAAYKTKLVKGADVLDLTGGFGVDSYYFAKFSEKVTHCEINPELSAIAEYNAGILDQKNIQFVSADGLVYLNNNGPFDTIYIDPARRSTSGKVFMLKDCTPDVTANLELLLLKAGRIIIKTAPLLDITAGLRELAHVTEIHIVSVKNECKELLWVIENTRTDRLKITAVTLNDAEKSFSFYKGEEQVEPDILEKGLLQYLYEPDAAVLKSGAFNLVASRFGLKKLHAQTQLYTSDHADRTFPGRIFKINRAIPPAELKKEKELFGNVIARNYRDKAENLIKKYKIKPLDSRFLIFTKTKHDSYLIIETDIIQHY